MEAKKTLMHPGYPCRKTHCVKCGSSKRPLHCLPADPVKLKAWLTLLKKDNLLDFGGKYLKNNGRVCGAHFADWTFTSSEKLALIKGALPCMDNPAPGYFPFMVRPRQDKTYHFARAQQISLENNIASNSSLFSTKNDKDSPLPSMLVKVKEEPIDEDEQEVVVSELIILKSFGDSVKERTETPSTKKRMVNKAIKKTIVDNGIREFTVQKGIQECIVNKDTEKSTVESYMKKSFLNKSGEESTINDGIEENTVNNGIQESTVNNCIQERAVTSCIKESTVNNSPEESTVKNNIGQDTINKSLGDRKCDLITNYIALVNLITNMNQADFLEVMQNKLQQDFQGRFKDDSSTTNFL